MSRMRTMFVVAAFLSVVIFLVFSSSARARDTLPSFGVCGLNGPSDIDVDNAGDVLYVADTDNHRVILLSQGFGCEAFVIGEEGDDEGEFSEPEGVAIDSSGLIYVADTGNDRVQRFQSIEGKNPGDEIGFLGSAGGINLSRPTGMGVDADDRIYVADTGNDRIALFNEAGSVDSIFGESGNGDGQFKEPVDVAVCRNDDDEIRNRTYVVDRVREDVQVFDSDHDFLFAFGTSGSDIGQFSGPSGIALDFQCNVYVVDSGNNRVQIFDPSGNFLESIGSLFDPTSVAISSFLGQGGAQGGVFVSVGSNQINRFVYVNYDTDGNGAIDDDGDGLPDLWEEEGIDLTFDGSVELDLPALGSDPDRKDIFVEVDYMEFHKFDETARENVVSAFAQSPVSNPDGTTGITLHIEMDAEIPHQDVIARWSGFNDLKKQHFGSAIQRAAPNASGILAAKRLSHRYALLIHTYDDPSTADSEAASGGFAEGGGNDFVLSLGNWDCNDPDPLDDGCDPPNHRTGTVQAQGYGFMHELGHTLNLSHGGNDRHNCKPNYISIMSYSYVSLGIPDVAEFNPTGMLVGRLDYSRERLPLLDEHTLDEPDGIGDGSDFTVWSPDEGNTRLAGQGNGPLNWNGKNQSNDRFVNVNINNVGIDGCKSAEKSVLPGHDDWSNLGFNFRGKANFADGIQVGDDSRPEFTFETAQEVRALWRDVFRPKYTYSAKFICVPEVGPEEDTVLPGRYRSVINVHNPGDKEVRFWKKAVIARNENKPRGLISPLVEDRLAGDEAVSINCYSIAKRFDGRAPVGDGFVVLKSNDPLDVVAVYTSRNSVDVEYIAPTLTEGQGDNNGEDDEDDRKKPDLAIALLERTQVNCPKGQGSCTHSVQVKIENPSAIDVTDQFVVSVSSDNGLVGSKTLSRLDGGQSQTFVVTLGPGDNCYNPNCRVEATVDARDAINESDEANNKASRTDQG